MCDLCYGKNEVLYKYEATWLTPYFEYIGTCWKCTGHITEIRPAKRAVDLQGATVSQAFFQLELNLISK